MAERLLKGRTESYQLPTLEEAEAYWSRECPDWPIEKVRAAAEAEILGAIAGIGETNDVLFPERDNQQLPGGS